MISTSGDSLENRAARTTTAACPGMTRAKLSAAASYKYRPTNEGPRSCLKHKEGRGPGGTGRPSTDSTLWADRRLTRSRPNVIYQWRKPGEPGSQDHYCGLSGDDESQANGSSILQVPTDQWRTSLVPQAQGGAGAWSNRAAKYGLDATGRPGVTGSRSNVNYIFFHKNRA